MNYQLDYSLLLSDYYFGRLLFGVQTTLLLFVICLSLGLVVAVLVTFLRSSPFRLLRAVAIIFVEYQRNVPLLVHLLVWYFGLASVLPQSVGDFANRNGGEFFFAAITLILYGGAFLSEDLRGGLRAIPAAQLEVARSLGMSLAKGLRYIVIPQAVRHALPPMLSQALSLFKNTSIAAAIGVAETMYRAREVSTETFRVFEAFSVATAVYFTGSLIIIGIGALLTRWLSIPGLSAK